MRRRGRRKTTFRQTAIVVLALVLGYLFVQAGFYFVTQGGFPALSIRNFGIKEADTSLGWNLILVNDDNRVPGNYEVELTELSNGEKVDSRIYPYLQDMFDDARAAGLELFVREGYRTTAEQQEIMDERIQEYREEGHSRREAKELPSDKTEITGVNNEPWHYRYVGADAAREIWEKGLCLEEYIELSEQN